MSDHQKNSCHNPNGNSGSHLASDPENKNSNRSLSPSDPPPPSHKSRLPSASPQIMEPQSLNGYGGGYAAHGQVPAEETRIKGRFKQFLEYISFPPIFRHTYHHRSSDNLKFIFVTSNNNGRRSTYLVGSNGDGDYDEHLDCNISLAYVVIAAIVVIFAMFIGFFGLVTWARS
ncbi:hypothetical protein B7494_g2555 [Chlorociboria aeruginascens]|nr:hypothetical protein B7494_g2555 [Chlorociboria aeruginascens]